MSKEYITLAELAKMLKISRATIDRWRKEGMPSIRLVTELGSLKSMSTIGLRNISLIKSQSKRPPEGNRYD